MEETLENPCHFWICTPRMVINYQAIAITLVVCNLVIVAGYTVLITCKCRNSSEEGAAVEEAQDALEEASGIENANVVDFNQMEEIDEEV